MTSNRPESPSSSVQAETRRLALKARLSELAKLHRQVKASQRRFSARGLAAWRAVATGVNP